MAIRKEHLAQLTEFIERSTEVNKTVMKGIVPNLMKNSEKVLGRDMKKNFFYRQFTWFEDFTRRNILSRFFELATLIYYTSPVRGEQFIQYAEAFFALLRATRTEHQQQHHPAKTYWQVQQLIDSLKSKQRTAMGEGDKQTARELHQPILQMERSVPMFLKSVLPSRKSSRRQKSGVKA